MKNFIFAYGSLMCQHSCARTIQREVLYIPATLKGHKRVFNAMGQVYHNSSEKKSMYVLQI